MFRSIPVPLKAAAGFLLTIAASLGAVCWIFQQGNLADVLAVSATGPIVSFLPILMIAILFGLAMDHEVFLVSRIRESFVHTGKARDVIVSGFQASARVFAAALIMIAVFSGFIIGDVFIKSIGWWLPPGMDGRMPGLGVEGEKLLHKAEPPAPAEGEHPPAPVADR